MVQRNIKPFSIPCSTKNRALGGGERPLGGKTKTKEKQKKQKRENKRKKRGKKKGKRKKNERTLGTRRTLERSRRLLGATEIDLVTCSCRVVESVAELRSGGARGSSQHPSESGTHVSRRRYGYVSRRVPASGGGVARARLHERRTAGITLNVRLRRLKDSSPQEDDRKNDDKQNACKQQNVLESPLPFPVH